MALGGHTKVPQFIHQSKNAFNQNLEKDAVRRCISETSGLNGAPPRLSFRPRVESGGFVRFRYYCHYCWQVGGDTEFLRGWEEQLESFPRESGRQRGAGHSRRVQKRNKAENFEMAGWGMRREVGRGGSKGKLTQKESRIKGCQWDCAELIILN